MDFPVEKQTAIYYFNMEVMEGGMELGVSLKKLSSIIVRNQYNLILENHPKQN